MLALLTPPSRLTLALPESWRVSELDVERLGSRLCFFASPAPLVLVLDVLLQLLPMDVDTALETLFVLLGRFSFAPLELCSLLTSPTERLPLTQGDA